jgi:transposase
MGKTRLSGMEETVVGGMEGGRSPTGVPPTTVAAAADRGTEPQNIPDPAVPEKPVRRRFTAEYKLQILQDADRCVEPGQLGALLRGEGLYSSHLSTWRRQREAGTLAGLTPKRRGRKPKRNDPLVEQNQQLQGENQQLREKLRQAETIIEVQKKLSEALRIPLNNAESNGSNP